MKAWLQSLIFPLTLCVLLGFASFWIEINTQTESLKIEKSKAEAMTKMYHVTLKNYNLQGYLEKSVISNEAVQKVNSQKYTLYNPDISHFNNGRLIQNVTSAEATYDTNTQEIKLLGNSENRPNQNNNRVRIIINEL